MLDNIIIYHPTWWCQCRPSVHVMRWNWHIFTIIAVLSTGRQLTLSDMIDKYWVHYRHNLHDPILHNLSDITK